MPFRDFKKDKLKSSQVLESQYGMNCCMDGCGKPLTKWQGPGQDLYCRDHQIKLVEYGGMGRSDRPHTLNREWVCAHCGYDPREDIRFAKIEDPIVKHRAMRACMIGDHTHRQVDGGDNSATNIQTLCSICNNIKTVTEEDYMPKKLVD